jgi:hypothetical protein
MPPPRRSHPVTAIFRAEPTCLTQVCADPWQSETSRALSVRFERRPRPAERGAAAPRQAAVAAAARRAVAAAPAVGRRRRRSTVAAAATDTASTSLMSRPLRRSSSTAARKRFPSHSSPAVATPAIMARSALITPTPLPLRSYWDAGRTARAVPPRAVGPVASRVLSSPLSSRAHRSLPLRRQ